MALCLNLLRRSGRLGFQKYLVSCNGFQRSFPVTTSATKQAVESFAEKNERLQRPLSPHLTIYRFPLPAMLSITHRATGIALTAGMYSISIGMLLLPANFPHYFEALQSMYIGTPIIFTMKFALAWSLFYHSFNGVRHLAWDLGYGFDMKTLYMTGYLVIGSSIAASLIAAML
uniref:Succinate dehydrogenase cytochrome b560 subunit, mitochondrial n=1 Tax=Parasteatoda tepidariorum TaxID=114398 RepID=A0A2L2Y344_PARTP